ncbi:hypothetical protein [Grimontia sp. NTOU-MAR1]|uniref:hypothetical protein n=1 Tax=Grimontia sp. NTOU-MAR1 TaxID=3111011 RepID=UPI002DBD66CE|nr:hypothetical protein [Grimontia sp. NTOU-MAR1]WRV97516.1 hypothetical protein VP504_15980 [Grimontia sp. NTOU-MAR1]
MDFKIPNLKWKCVLRSTAIFSILFALIFAFCLYIGDRTYGDIYFFFHHEADNNDKTSNIFAMVDIDEALIENSNLKEKLFRSYDYYHHKKIDFDIYRAPDGDRLSYMLRIKDIEEEKFERIRDELITIFYSYLYDYRWMCKNRKIEFGCAKKYSAVNNMALYMDVTSYKYHSVDFKTMVKIILFSIFTTLCCLSLLHKKETK